jgi:hypothetical protein
LMNWAMVVMIFLVDDEKMTIEAAIHNVRIHYVTMVVKQHNDYCKSI